MRRHVTTGSSTFGDLGGGTVSLVRSWHQGPHPVAMTGPIKSDRGLEASAVSSGKWPGGTGPSHEPERPAGEGRWQERPGLRVKDLGSSTSLPLPSI